MENRSPSFQPNKKFKSEKKKIFKNSKSLFFSTRKKSGRNGTPRSEKSSTKYPENAIKHIEIKTAENIDSMRTISSSEITPFFALNPEIQFVSQEHEINDIQDNRSDSEVKNLLGTSIGYRDSESINEVTKIEEDENVTPNLSRNQDLEVNGKERVIAHIEDAPESYNSQTTECQNLSGSQAFSNGTNHINPFWGDFPNSKAVEEESFYPALNCAEHNDLINKDVMTSQEIKDFINNEFFDSDLDGLDNSQSSSLSDNSLSFSKLNKAPSKQNPSLFKSNRNEENSEIGAKDQSHEVLVIPTSNETLQTLLENNSFNYESNKNLAPSSTYEELSGSLNVENSAMVENSKEEVKEEPSPRMTLSKEDGQSSWSNSEIGAKDQNHEDLVIPISNETLQTLSENNSFNYESNKNLAHSSTNEQLSGSLNVKNSAVEEKSKEEAKEESLPRLALSKEDGQSSSERNRFRINRFSSLDESAAFAHFVACQLRYLPLSNALLCQNAIIQIIIDERRRLIENQGTSTIFIERNRLR